MTDPRHVRFLPAVLLALGAALGTGPVGAQDVTLESPSVVFPESYSFIQTVREMPDGRVLWADPLGQALVIGDLDAGVADTLGRVGEGPAEYRQPDAVHPLPGDSTLLVDLGNGRLTVLTPELEFGETQPIGQGRPGPGMVMALPRTISRDGTVYIAGRAGMRPGMSETPDSAPVLSYDRATQSVDTVAMVRTEGRTVNRSGGAGNRQVSIDIIPLSGSDGWTVDADGRVGIARLGDYHFEWIDRNGTVTAGAPVEVDRVRIGQAEKEEWDRNRTRSGGGLSISIGMNNGVAQMSFQRGGQGSPDSGLDQYDWPDRKPPFYSNGITVDTAGRAWVRRHVDAGDPPMFDVFGLDAQHVATVQLPPNRRIVGFGVAGLYAVYMDEFDLNHLERYEVPAL